MAVTDADILTSELSEDDDGHRTYTTTVQVVTDSKLDGSLTALQGAQSLVPSAARGSSYSFGSEADNWAFCKKRPTVKLAEPGKSKRVWLVTVEHTTKPSKRCSEYEIENPLDMPPVLSGSWVAKQVPVEMDKDGKPITNSAGERFIPAPEIEDHDDTLIYEVNTASINLPLRSSFRHSVNDGTLWGVPERCVRLASWTWDVAYYGQCYSYIRNRLEFAIRDEDSPWVFEPLDAGHHELVDNKLVPIRAADDAPLAAPWPLKADGTKMAEDDEDWPGLFLEGDDAIKIYREKNYHALPILDPLPGPFA